MNSAEQFETIVSEHYEALFRFALTWVILEEVKSGDWGLAGNPLTTSDAKALLAGLPKAA